jgi:hypothetical protein
MSEDLEKPLRSALRPEDPGEQFTRNVMAAIAQQDSSRSRATTARPRATLRWASAALVISLVVVVITTHHRQERGLEARRQLLQALQLTGEKLDVAYQAVKDVERAP